MVVVVPLWFVRYASVRTPGGKLAVQYRKKAANGPKCGDCGTSIQGVCIALERPPCPSQARSLSSLSLYVSR